MLFTSTNAQNQMQKLPVDEAARIGTLDNGMRYYIYKNDKPSKLANFYIVHNVGAIQEEDHQNGLAHFLEHMAFNGTTNLPGKMMLNYMQKNGMEFGRDINAMTGVNTTQYMLLNVPVTNAGLVDTVLMTIADWSGGVALEPSEIDAERGVILEEKRTGDTAQRRIQTQMMNHMFHGTKYTERDVIGTEDIIMNFPYQDIRDFYHKWYRPDLQAVVIVGDIDVDAMEEKVKSLMGALPVAINPAPKESYVVEPYAEDYAVVITDKENHSTSANMMSILPKMDEAFNDTYEAMYIRIARGIVANIAKERFADIARQPNAPFLGASYGVQSISPFNDVLSTSVYTNNGALEEGIAAVTSEVKKLNMYGITEDELARVVTGYMTGIQRSYDNRADRKTETIAEMLIYNYTDNSPILSAEMEYEVLKGLLTNLTAEGINKMMPMLFPEGATCIAAVTPEREGETITVEAVMSAYTKGMTATVEAPVANKIDRPLIEKEPKSVKIKKETKDELGNTVWTLKNGAKVVVRPTNFRADEVIFTATAEGGYNYVSDEDYVNVPLVSNMLDQSGLGTFTTSDLSKVLAGNTASVGKNISVTAHGLSGNAAKQDLETLLQLVYLSVTAQRLDSDTYEMLMQAYAGRMRGIESTPDYIFQEKLNESLYANHPRVQQLNAERLANISLDKVKSVHDKIFNGVDGMTFVIVGAVELEVLKPLVEKYIASLPKGKKLKGSTYSIDIKEGDISETIAVKQENPITTYSVSYYTDEVSDISVRQQLIARFLAEVLTVKYTHSIREEMGATYGVSTNVSVGRVPARVSIDIAFDTNDEKLIIAQPQVLKELSDIAEGADISEELEMSRGVMLKNYNKSISSNNSLWASWITQYYRYGDNSFKEYIEALNTITTSEIQSMAKHVLETGNTVEVIRRSVVE